MRRIAEMIGLVVGLAIGWLVFSPGHLAESQGLPGQVQPRRIVTIADTTIGSGISSLALSDENRMFLNCTNNDAVNSVRWGECGTGIGCAGGVSSTRGQRLGPGATITSNGTYALYMTREGASSVVVSCTTELRN